MSHNYGEGAGDLCALALALKLGWPETVPDPVKYKSGLDDESLRRVGDALYRLSDVLDDNEMSVTDLKNYIPEVLGLELKGRGKPEGSSQNNVVFVMRLRSKS